MKDPLDLSQMYQPVHKHNRKWN